MTGLKAIELAELIQPKERLERSNRLSDFDRLKTNSDGFFQVGINKQLGQLFKLLNDLNIKPQLIDQIYETVRQEVI